jgi:hypothetical protein
MLGELIGKRKPPWITTIKAGREFSETLVRKTPRATFHSGGRSPDGWRLGRPFFVYCPRCRGPRDPHDVRCGKFPVGEDLVNPGRLCSSCRRSSPTRIMAISPIGLQVPIRHDQWETGQHDRRETRPRIGGPDGPGGVASLISTLLS